MVLGLERVDPDGEVGPAFEVPDVGQDREDGQQHRNDDEGDCRKRLPAQAPPPNPPPDGGRERRTPQGSG